MRYLALDVGIKRTGVAFLDDATSIPLPLDTFASASDEEFASQVMQIVTAREIDQVYVGLPRLPSGEEGAQAAFVRRRANLLVNHHIPVQFIDERYTTPRKARTLKDRQIPERKTDSDSAAACEILRIAGKI